MFVFQAKQYLGFWMSCKAQPPSPGNYNQQVKSKASFSNYRRQFQRSGSVNASWSSGWEIKSCWLFTSSFILLPSNSAMTSIRSHKHLILWRKKAKTKKNGCLALLPWAKQAQWARVWLNNPLACLYWAISSIRSLVRAVGQTLSGIEVFSTKSILCEVGIKYSSCYTARCRG